MKRFILSMALVFWGAGASGEEIPADSVIRIDPVQVTTIKQGHDLSSQPVAASVVGQPELERQHVAALKEVSQMAPNFFAPDYGSRMTSSIYVRGMGARIDQPVVGLTVDNVPVLSKDAYDLELADIERIEVLRGPQSTLFGRNTIGGMIHIYTLSPFTFEGTRLGFDYGSGHTIRSRVSHYLRVDERIGLSVGVQYGQSDGFFTNRHTGEKCDWERGGGGRFKLQYRDERLRVDNTLSFNSSRQGGYPYAFVETGRIDYNDESSYRRTLLSDGLTIRYGTADFSVASITGYQYLDDRMRLDQDFLPASYFTLEQARKEHAVTQDVVFSGQVGDYRWLAGAFGFYRHTRMQAPVLFKEDGLQELILDRYEQGLGVEAQWGEETFLLDSRFRSPNYGGAIYHESSYRLGGWCFTAGVRLDVEASQLKYRSLADATYTTTTDGVVYPHVIQIDNGGRLKQHFIELLPKAAIRYGWNDNTVYASVAKGYKAGGFNTQMFSDVLQQQVMKQMGIGSLQDVGEIVTYRPEKSWNYEVGAHLIAPSRTWQADLALFYIDCRDQQLTVFPPGQVAGRRMANAGRTRSFGVEASVRATLWRRFDLRAAYGYTNATFLRFSDGRADYAGKHVPYAPAHTLFAAAAYTLPIHRNWLEQIVFRVATSGAGKIYWNEGNTLSQPFYALLEASVRFEQRRYAIDLWARNLLDRRFDVFHFASIGHSFLQRGRPRTFGVSISIIL